MKNNDFEWIPNESVGKLRFGEAVAQYIKAGLLERCDELSDEDENDCFLFEDELDITVYADKDGFINSIHSDASLIYGGQDLIGLSLDQVVKILGREPDEIGEPIELGDDDVQTTAEFVSFGLQLWLRENIAVSAGVYFDDPDDDQ